MSIVDFSVQLKLGEDSRVIYHMGFSSSEQERIVVQAGNEVLMRVYDGLTKAPSISENGWHIEKIKTHSGSIIQVVNSTSVFSVNKRSSFVTSPSVIDDSSGTTAKAFSRVLSLATQGRLS
jgi:hypothetical protein